MPQPTDYTRPLAVLIVDDNRDAADTLAAALGIHGYVARVFYDGPTALGASAADPPDVALLDIGMRGMTGWELARRLRAAVPGRRPLLVAVSGHGTAADAHRSREAGIDLHLVKPVDLGVIVGVLRRFERAVAGDAPATGPDVPPPGLRPGGASGGSRPVGTRPLPALGKPPFGRAGRPAATPQPTRHPAPDGIERPVGPHLGIWP